MENLSQHQRNATWIQSINKENIARDEQGRIIIRIPELIKKSLENKPINALSNKLITPTDRIIQQPIGLWVKKLLDKYNETINLNKYKRSAERLAEVYNNAALVYFSLGEVNKARDLCYAQIHLFIKRFQHFTFQPWVNLSRIDRITGNYNQALSKLTALDEIDYDRLGGENKEVARAVQTCALLEPIKVYLEMGSYQKVIDFIGERQDKFLNEHHAFMYEGLITALSNLNKTHDLLEVLHFIKTKASPMLTPIFLLREAELFNDPVLINKLFVYCNKLFQEKNTDSNHIIFSLHLAELLKSINQPSKAIELLERCIQQAIIINDEAILIQSLIMLYPLLDNYPERNKVEDLIINCYRDTLYVSLRKKLLQTCPMLSVIKTASPIQEINELYQRLSCRTDFF